ncbi:MAG: hypothetical protein SV375_07285 [Thermodesulfobacteriota bacterium]|nr:hypothetical protein [Thermodesulfobacteriota bacterium]
MHWLTWVGLILIAVGTALTLIGQQKINDRSSKIIQDKSEKIEELSQENVRLSGEMKKQLENQVDELYNLKVIALSTNQRVDDLNKSEEQISGKGTQFQVRGVPSIAEYFPLVFKSNLGLITGYARVKGTKEFHRFSTKVNDKVPVVIHNLWLSDKKQYQSPPVLELVIDHQADEKDTLSVFTKGFFLPDGM